MDRGCGKNGRFGSSHAKVGYFSFEIWLKIHEIVKPELKSLPEVQSAWYCHLLVKFEIISWMEWLEKKFFFFCHFWKYMINFKLMAFLNDFMHRDKIALKLKILWSRLKCSLILFNFHNKKLGYLSLRCR